MYTDNQPIEVGISFPSSLSRAEKSEILRQLREKVKHDFFTTVMNSPIPLVVYGYKETYHINNNIMDYDDIEHMSIAVYLNKPYLSEGAIDGFAGDPLVRTYHFEFRIPEYEMIERRRAAYGLNLNLGHLSGIQIGEGMRIGRTIEAQMESLRQSEL